MMKKSPSRGVALPATLSVLRASQSRLHQGLEYENQACAYLIREGYQILAQNVRYAFGEIDIVAQKGKCLVFIEVRKRAAAQGSRHFIAPQETISPAKKRRLKNAIQAYLARYEGRADEVRIDLIGFIEREGRVELTHFRDFVGG